jgi:hypothetical protein
MNKEKLFDVVVATIKTNKEKVITLVRKNGLPLQNNASDEEVFNAFVSLAKTSPKFREEFASLVKTIEAQVQGELNATGSVNFGREPIKETSSGSGSSGSSFGEYMGKIFTPEVTSNLVNNIFGLFGGRSQDYSQDYSNANMRFEQQQAEKKGLSIGAIVGISIGVIALIGLTIYLVRKK